MEEQNKPSEQEKSDNKLDIGLQILSFIFPVAGAIIYFINKDNSPEKAKSACYISLWGLACGILINLLMTISTKV